MRYFTSRLVAPAALAIVLGRPTALRAQSSVSPASREMAIQIERRSQERASRWSETAPVIHCGPAPLTERPGAASELARPRMAPLEAAFLDAAAARQEFVSRSHAALTRP
jgi:hypothetical protein